MRRSFILTGAVLIFAVLGCGSHSAGNITGSNPDQVAGSSGGDRIDDNIIGPPIRTELAPQRIIPVPTDDPRDENIIGPPIKTELE